MDDTLLVGVLNSVTDLDEQIETMLGAKAGLIAVIGDLDDPRRV